MNHRIGVLIEGNETLLQVCASLETSMVIYQYLVIPHLGYCVALIRGYIAGRTNIDMPEKTYGATNLMNSMTETSEV